MIKNPPWSFDGKVLTINGKPLSDYMVISKGDWFIEGSEVKLSCYYIDGILNIWEGWIIDKYQVRKDEETCGNNEFTFIDKTTKEEYEFDPEPLGIFKED